MNWIDLALVLMVAAVTAVAAQRRFGGLLLGLGGLVLIRPLLALIQLSPILALAAALLAGFGLGFAGRTLSQRVKLQPRMGGLLGGLGGFVLGCLLLLTIVTSLPIERDINGAIVYPPQQLPLPFETAVPQSQLMQMGRSILLYPLLVQYELIEPSRALSGLHDFLVVVRPWEGG